ncbi:MAG TPA: DEAD/DEAH box helicase, partial [Pyrinomonadaceae bacterium]|nr:DEAD/DEAH box helicase [Pyrinomonadaceae bacterium]
MEIFEVCRSINGHLEAGDESTARDELIQLLDFHEKAKIDYSPLVNHLIRTTGLFPYLQPETSIWQDRFAYSAFRVDMGGPKQAILHRDQAGLLKRLLEGENIAVSAPTSFGKSLVIDGFIALKRPNNIVIIVPTIALMDETRRRLYRKFGSDYNVITTGDAEILDKNIFIFPAERAVNYIDRLDHIDLLVVDEFYKASALFDPERAPELLRAILKLTAKASQRYFLAPNISSLLENVFTKGMTFINLLGSHTVFLERHELFHLISNDREKGEA